MKVGDLVRLKGYITQYHFVVRKTGPQIEQLLGYRAGRLGQGWVLLFLTSLPKPDDFEFRGYSHMSGGVAEGHKDATKDKRTAEQKLKDAGIELEKLKRRIMDDVFSINGARRLVKILPTRLPFGLKDYPPGDGVPQWELTTKLPFKVGAVIPPGGRNWVDDVEV